ncbi:PAS domain S-box protein [candidate division KSB1 bacterium]
MSKKRNKPTYDELEQRIKEIEEALSVNEEKFDKTLELLIQSEKQFRDLVEKGNVAISMEDIDGNLTYSNANNAALYGYTVCELMTKKYSDVVHPDDLEKVQNNHKKRVAGKKVKRYEFRGLKKDGSIIWLDVDSVPVKEDGKIVGVRNYFWDITERKKADEALKSEKDFSTKLIDSSPAFFVAIDHRGFLKMISKSMLRALGYKKEEVLEKEYMSIFVPKKDRKKLAKVFNELTAKETSAYTVNRILSKNGKEFTTEWYGKSIFDNEGNFDYFFGVGMDISEKSKAEDEKNKLQDQLFQAQKMESVGRLAGGIAHDFNNILTSIIGYAELLKMRLGDKSQRNSQAVSVILESSHRAAVLTKQLLGFARKGKHEPEPMDLNNTLQHVLMVLDRIFEKNIEIVTDFGTIPNVYADRNWMDQVFTNIIINAKDAMPDGGTLMIKTDVINLDYNLITSIPEIEPGEYVRTAITDTGTGMSKKTTDRVFEPFFTTKREGEGTGLGLATVYGIIKNHGGNVTVYSELGEGTTFNIYLPITLEDVAEDKIEAEIVEGDATILVVDDEEHIRDIAKSRLEQAGYSVLSAEDGRKGLEMYLDNKDKIDIVLLDMIMPNMSGKESFLAMKGVNSDVKVIIMSGFSKTGKVEEILYEGAVGFIQKPFSLQELTQIIADTLN